MGLLSRIKNVFIGDEAPGNAGYALKVDMHSHLLPGIDDGSHDIQDSVRMIREIASRGVEKIITTPHIIEELYRNTPEIIGAKLEEVKEALAQEKIDVKLEAAAEYYLDDAFIRMVKDRVPLLTFGDRYVLVETNYIQQDPRLKAVFFDMKLQDYKPVFAHPERYLYMNHPPNFHELTDIFDSQVFFQVNLLSFTGFYGPQIKTIAEFMLKHEMIHFLGSDIHRIEHAQAINRFKDTKGFEKVMKLKVMNNLL